MRLRLRTATATATAIATVSDGHGDGNELKVIETWRMGGPPEGRGGKAPKTPKRLGLKEEGAMRPSSEK